MSSGAPAAAETNPSSLDIDDKLNLGAPGRYDESSYDATGPDTLVTPPVGNPWVNYGIWFDRDGVDQWQATYWGSIDGATYNTGGIYRVTVTFHAVSGLEGKGTMFATVNGVPTGFYDDGWYNGPPQHYPVGKSFVGDLSYLRVYADIRGENVKVYNLTATGYLFWTEVQIDIKPGSYPNSINLKAQGVVPVAVLTTMGFDARTVDPSTVLFAKASPVRWVLEDVDQDGDTDMLFHFRTQDLELGPTSTEATLTADTVDGKHIRGTDTVNIVSK